METDAAFESIQAAILPHAALLLDCLLDSAALAVPGLDCAVYADELRSLAARVDDLTAQVAALAPAQQPPRARISA
jgi:hypothetical protein